MSDGDSLADLPLDGVVVLDFTRYLAGPFGTMLMRDLGARVIKVETATGDPARDTGPFQGSDSAYFHPINRGKESVVIDLRDEEQVHRLQSLLPKVDVLTESFRPGVMESIGLGPHDALREQERLIYASLSGFGSDGPYAGRPAFDVVVQAMGGVMSVTGPNAHTPTRVGVSQGDIVAGIYLAGAISTALFRRDRTGHGCYIDLSMYESQLTLVTHAVGIRVATGTDPHPIGNRHPAIAPFDVYETRDGGIAVAAVNDAAFQTLCEVLALSTLVDEPAFATASARLENVEALSARLGVVTADWRTSDLVAQLLERGIPCGPVATMGDLLEDVHLRERRAFGVIRDWGDDGLPVPGVPFLMNGRRFVTEERAPEIGSLSIADLEASL